MKITKLSKWETTYTIWQHWVCWYKVELKSLGMIDNKRERNWLYTYTQTDKVCHNWGETIIAQWIKDGWWKNDLNGCTKLIKNFKISDENQELHKHLTLKKRHNSSAGWRVNMETRTVGKGEASANECCHVKRRVGLFVRFWLVEDIPKSQSFISSSSDDSLTIRWHGLYK